MFSVLFPAPPLVHAGRAGQQVGDACDGVGAERRHRGHRCDLRPARGACRAGSARLRRPQRSRERRSPPSPRHAIALTEYRNRVPATRYRVHWVCEHLNRFLQAAEPSSFNAPKGRGDGMPRPERHAPACSPVSKNIPLQGSGLVARAHWVRPVQSAVREPRQSVRRQLSWRRQIFVARAV